MTQFPELQKVGTTFVQACQALGLGLLAAMICLIALMIFTSLGNEHRQTYARVAAFGVIIGFALLMLSPVAAAAVKTMFPVNTPPP
ncbi:MAG: hypothetical protein J2P37_26910, partial [Ktedonobacteraceae bacterium]|nr:hypothetical protein [Ktedonobacteraceae bacterium]